MTPRSSRQTLLVGLLAVVLPTAAFAALRGAPRWRELSGLRESATELRLDLDSLPRPSGAAMGDREQLRQAGASLEAVGAKLECCTPFAGPDEQRALALDLSNLAQESGLWLESRETIGSGGALAARAPRAAPSYNLSSVFEDGDYVEAARAPSAASAALPTQANLAACLQSAPLSRRLERWTARGSFSGLRAFLARLSKLPYCVVVVHVEVERPRRPSDEERDLPLSIRLTVAL